MFLGVPFKRKSSFGSSSRLRGCSCVAIEIVVVVMVVVVAVSMRADDVLISGRIRVFPNNSNEKVILRYRDFHFDKESSSPYKMMTEKLSLARSGCDA